MNNPINIVLINGWAMPKNIWEGFIDKLEAQANFGSVRVVDIDRCMTVKEWVNYLDDLVQPNTLLIGWSLGGQLAVEYSAQHPEKLVGLCTLQMNPKFVVSSDWPHGMAMETFFEFKRLAEYDAVKMVKRFGFLVTAKGHEALQDLKQLQKMFIADTLPPVDVLLQGLELLETLDVRAVISEISFPQLHIYGESDQLVPCAVAASMSSFISTKDDLEKGDVELVAGLSHFPCLGSVTQVIDRICKFSGGLS